MSTNSVHETEENQSIKVAIRIRPLNAKEKDRQVPNFDWKIEKTSLTQIVDGKQTPNSTYEFDNVFAYESTNQDIYESVARSLVRSTVDGFNSVIFAYGQTSSGKTHTMLGNDQDPGITPRSIKELFDFITANQDREFLVRVSYVEIYNEVIRDLLTPGSENLKVHEDFSGRIFTDAREDIAVSSEEVLSIMRQGEEQRTFGATNMNETSSRSHTIFTIVVESRKKSTAEESEENGITVRVSALSLVDLAGSERASLTGAEGVRLKEGSHINKSLLTLGTVINKLSEGNVAHIPYRDSKLTRILQPALGGNAYTAIICAITPAFIHAEESLSTLRFASRAQKVTNKTQCNEILDDRAKLKKALKEIELLKALLSKESISTLEGPDNTEQNENSKRNELTHTLSSEQDRQKYILLEEKCQQLEIQLGVERENSQALKQKLNTINQDIFEKLSASIQSNKENRVVNRRETIQNAPNLLHFQKYGGDTAYLQEKIERLSNEILQYEKVASDATREMRRHSKAIQYERDAMKNEVIALESFAEKAEIRAVQASEEAQSFRKLNSKMKISLQLDGIIQNAMYESDIRQLALQNKKLKETGSADEMEKDSLQKEITRLKKVLQESERKQKLGMNPILKELNHTKEKCAALEGKLKSINDAYKRTNAENRQFDQERKELQRQIKTQSCTLKVKELQSMLDSVQKQKSEGDEELQKMKNRLEEEGKGRDQVLRLTNELEHCRDELRKLGDLTESFKKSEAQLIEEKKLAESRSSHLNLQLEEKQRDIKELLKRLKEQEEAANTGTPEQTQKRNERLAKVLRENSSLLKQQKTLAETIHNRDHAIAMLEEKFDRLWTNDGEIGKLQRKLARRENELLTLKHQLKQVEQVFALNSRGSEFLDVCSVAELQSEIEILKKVTITQDEQIRSLEQDRFQLLKESSKLRQSLKDRDRLRISLDAKLKEAEAQKLVQSEP